MNKLDFFISAAEVKLPKIIYGTAWKKDRTASLVELAIETGFRGIDTACQPKHYHEAGVGEGIAACIRRGIIHRPELYLQSKFTPLDGQDPNRIPYNPNGDLADQIATSFRVSLSNLQTDYLDGLILHSPLATPQQTHEAWLAMEKLVISGGVKQLGVSNCYDIRTFEDLYTKADIKPAILQNRFYANTGYDGELRAFCKQNGVIYQSFWTLTANPHVLANANLLNIAKRCGRSPAQVFFRYLSQIGIVPLTGTTSPLHMREDLAIADFELSPDECKTIEGLLKVLSV